MTETFNIEKVNIYLTSLLSDFINNDEDSKIKKMMQYVDIIPLLGSLSDKRLLSFCNLIDLEYDSSHKTDKNERIHEIKNVILPKIKNEHYFELIHDNFIEGVGIESVYIEYCMTISCYPPINNNNNNNNDKYIFSIDIVLSGHQCSEESINFDLDEIEIDDFSFQKNVSEEEKKNAILAFTNNGFKYINSKLSNTIISSCTNEIHHKCCLILEENEMYDDEEDDEEDHEDN